MNRDLPDPGGREAFLARIRQALGREVAAVTPPPPPTVPAALVAPSVAGLSEAELVAVFSERAAALGVVVVRVASLAEACAKLPDLLAPYGRSVAADESEWGAALAAAAELPLVPSEVADIGLTHAWRGVAETGTLLVRSDVGRRAALLPRVHLMALALTDLRPGLSEVLAEVSALAEPPRALVAISGPSRTGDIEMTLVTGVHGPEQVVLLLVG